VLRTNGDVGPGEPQPGLCDLEGLITRTERAGLPVELRVRGQARPLPAGVEICAFRIVQEALTNVLKHAGPARAEVAVDYGHTLLELRISDTGHGLRTAERSRHGTGHGLVGMRERAALVGGELTVGPSPRGGVSITATLPIDGVAQ
jgi:signal transduction histidine kinase